MSVNEALRIVGERWRVLLICLLLGLLGATLALIQIPRQYSRASRCTCPCRGGPPVRTRPTRPASWPRSGRRIAADDRRPDHPGGGRSAPAADDGRAARPAPHRDRRPGHRRVTESVTDTSPEQAAAIANAVAEQFVGLTRRWSSSSRSARLRRRRSPPATGVLRADPRGHAGRGQRPDRDADHPAGHAVDDPGFAECSVRGGPRGGARPVDRDRRGVRAARPGHLDPRSGPPRPSPGCRCWPRSPPTAVPRCAAVDQTGVSDGAAADLVRCCLDQAERGAAARAARAW